jgi:Acyl-CoA reductase (LuxC)
MNLPNYFLADLPPEATLTATMLAEACRTLKRNRDRFLANRSTRSLIHLLSEVASDWLNPENPFRKMAVENGPVSTGFSQTTLATGLDAFFKQLTPANFNALLEQDFGHQDRLDALVSSAVEQRVNRAAMANAPEFLVHIAAGNVPSPILMSMALGVLTRSAQFVKCAQGNAWLPRLFAHSLYRAEPKLGACLEVAEWHGGQIDLEEVVFGEADCVTAAGTDETLATVRSRLGPRTRFLGYGHRLSFAYVSNRMLSSHHARKVAARAAADVVAWNQLGCLSPHVIYAQHGGERTPEQFAELLAEELAVREEAEPRGSLSPEASAAIASRRALYEVRAAHSPDTRHWFSPGSTAWTVVFETDPRFQVSCLNRFIYVKQAQDLTDALQGADSVRGRVSTVGLSAPEDLAHELAADLARWGAPRVCPLGQMQSPPLTWRHDGRPTLGDLVTWTDWET